MKEGWEIKKLGEVADVVNGYTPKVDELSTEGVYPYFKVAEMNILENSTIMTKTSTYVSCPKKIYKKGTIVFPKNGAAISTNKKRILGQDSVVDLNTAGFVANELLLIEFFYRFIQHIDFKRFVRRGAVPTLDMKELKESSIPVPPLAEQQRIVAELDCINGIIEKKKQQLKELDNLAQAIFYDMFGDPITNEKGWEVKKFAEMYKLKSGDGLSAKDFREGTIPVYGGNGISGYHDSFNMDGDYIIIGRVGVYCGNVRKVSGKFWLTDNAFQLFYDKGLQIPTFVHYLLNILNLHQYANAAAQPVISNSTLRAIDIPLPPLPLQQSFAAKVEAIEKQKALIKQSIAESETLLASRMDYYFN